MKTQFSIRVNLCNPRLNDRIRAGVAKKTIAYKAAKSNKFHQF